jgi:iron complex transport system permease protein
MTPDSARSGAPRIGRLLVGCGLAVACALLLAILFGSTSADLGEALSDASSLAGRKIFGLRLPRALAAGIVGAALALAGMVFQSLLQNPLASPYVLGVSAGGSLGAALATLAQLPSLQGPAFLGCLLAILLVYVLGWHRPGESPISLLLAGVIVNSFLSALILLVQVLIGQKDRDRLFRWLVGGFPELVGAGDLARSGACLAAGLLGAFLLARPLAALALGEDAALRLGVDVGKLRPGLFILASVLTGAAVALAGPIGFVGLIIPHVSRLLLGNDPHRLVIANAGIGAVFLILVDLLARSLLEVAIPTGVVTAFLGGPFFIVLLRRARHRDGLHGL